MCLTFNNRPVSVKHQMHAWKFYHRDGQFMKLTIYGVNEVVENLVEIFKKNQKPVIEEWSIVSIAVVKCLVRDRPDLLELKDDEGKLFTFDTKLPLHIWRMLAGAYSIGGCFEINGKAECILNDAPWKGELPNAKRKYLELCKEFKQFKMLKEKLEKSKKRDLKKNFERILPFVVIQPSQVEMIGYDGEKTKQLQKNVAILKLTAYLCLESKIFTPYTKLHQEMWKFLAGPCGCDRGFFASDKFKKILLDKLDVTDEDDNHILSEWEEIKSNKLSPGQILFEELYTETNKCDWIELTEKVMYTCNFMCFYSGNYTVVEFDLY